MGVSKQAAQQRFVPPVAAMDEALLRSGEYERFTDRARRVIATAHEVARAAGQVPVGSLHLVQSAGARTLTNLGGTRKQSEQWIIAALEAFKRGRSAR